MPIYFRKFNYNRGQFCYLRIPQISYLESHPFSISSAPNDPKLLTLSTSNGAEVKLTCHIKSMGKNTWTDELATLHKNDQLNSIRVYLDGPYGNFSIPLQLYPVVILVAGGNFTYNCYYHRL